MVRFGWPSAVGPPVLERQQAYTGVRTGNVAQVEYVRSDAERRFRPVRARGAGHGPGRLHAAARGPRLHAGRDSAGR